MRIADGSERLGLHVVQEAVGACTVTHNLTDIINAEDVSICGTGIVDSGVCATAEEKSMAVIAGIKVVADDISGRVDALAIGVDRSRWVKLHVRPLRPRQRGRYCQ